MCDRMLVSALAIAAAIGSAPQVVAAQDWREVTSFRQRSSESAMDVHLRYGAGELWVHPGESGELYRLDLRYDADAFEPVTEYANGRLEVGVEGTGRGLKLRNTEAGEMRLFLSPEVPLDLDLDFGAVEAELDLGGLRIARLDMETGASDTELSFSAPNPIECENLNLSMGAAAFDGQGLGNANCRRLEVEGGVGDLTLDFSGVWKRDMDADITIALGSVTLLIPEDVGVRVDKETFLADFSGSRFRTDDGTRYSDNWDTAERRLTIQLEGAFGSIDVRWIAPTLATP